MLKRIFWWIPPTAVVIALACLCPAIPAQQGKGGKDGKKLEDLPRPQVMPGLVAEAPPPSTLNPNVKAIDLCAALKLAGVYNPEILLARERVTAADAERQFAAAQILPTINYGGNFDMHQGVLQQSTGKILHVNRDSLYLGLGSNAIAAGTVNIPGIMWSGNVSQGIYAALTAKQLVVRREFESIAVRNDVFLRVVTAYLDLVRATGKRAVVMQNRADAAEMARVTQNFAKAGEGRQSDADRAATELQLVNDEQIQSDAEIEVASARLAQLLNLDPSVRLYPTDIYVVPAPVVPDPIPLPELLTIALTQRPELQAQQAAIRGALYALDAAKVLPFSPNVILGYSNGSFGGGSDLQKQLGTQPRFGSFDDRQDIDAVLWWSLQNLGVGNLAMIRLAGSNARQAELRQFIVLNQIRAEVASAYARSHARYAQIGTAEKAVTAGRRAYQEDLFRTRNGQGLPIELLDSMRLMGRSRLTYLNTIIDYNRAQFELYVSLGQPPACTLARPVPRSLVPEVMQPAPPPQPTPPVAPPVVPSKKK